MWKQNARRIDEILWGIDAALATVPEKFPRVPDLEMDIRVILTEPALDSPPFRIYFRIDDANTVTLLYMEPIQQNNH